MRNLMLASRNLLRHKRKTLAVLSALIVGLAGLVVFQGFLSEMMRIWRDSSILSGVGHLQVAGEPGYFEDGEFNPYAYPFPKAAQVAARLLEEPGVEAVFPSTGFVAMAGFGDASKTILVKAYPAERSFFAPRKGATKAPSDRFLLGTLESGDPIRPGERDTLVLGAGSARILGAVAGDTVTLMAILPGGQLTGRDFVVSGIFSVLPGQDDLYAYTDYDTAADFTGLSGPPVLDVLLDGVDRVDAVAASLSARSELPHLEGPCAALRAGQFDTGQFPRGHPNRHSARHSLHPRQHDEPGRGRADAGVGRFAPWARRSGTSSSSCSARGVSWEPPAPSSAFSSASGSRRRSTCLAGSVFRKGPSCGRSSIVPVWIPSSSTSFRPRSSPDSPRSFRDAKP